MTFTDPAGRPMTKAQLVLEFADEGCSVEAIAVGLRMQRHHVRAIVRAECWPWRRPVPVDSKAKAAGGNV